MLANDLVLGHWPQGTPLASNALPIHLLLLLHAFAWLSLAMTRSFLATARSLVQSGVQGDGPKGRILALIGLPQKPIASLLSTNVS